MGRRLSVRHHTLRVKSKHPYNAEPPCSVLAENYFTPVELFYKRNHGNIPAFDEEGIETYPITVGGLVRNPTTLTLSDIKKLPKHELVVTFQCAGNRRNQMKSTDVHGINSDECAIGNGTWGGCRMVDFLEKFGIPKYTKKSVLGAKHIEFVGADKNTIDGDLYKQSIPLARATDPESDVLIAYEMNGEHLNSDHGFPLRVVVPGVIGARSTKWLTTINLLHEESEGHWVKNDYKVPPPWIPDPTPADWAARRPLMEMNVQSAISSVLEGDVLKPGKVKIVGYAISGGARGIDRVDVSPDGGKTWVEASRYQKPGVKYISDDDVNRDKWAWVFFETEIEVKEDTQIISRAVDISTNFQPETVEPLWNHSGLMNNSWFRVNVKVQKLL